MKNSDELADLIKGRLDALFGAIEKAKKRPDLSYEEWYEYAFKDVVTKEQYQKILKETDEKMMKYMMEVNKRKH